MSNYLQLMRLLHGNDRSHCNIIVLTIARFIKISDLDLFNDNLLYHFIHIIHYQLIEQQFFFLYFLYPTLQRQSAARFQGKFHH